MNSILSKYFFYYPVTLAKGEVVAKYLSSYGRFQYKSEADIAAYQLGKLKKIVSHAYNNSDFYRRSFDEHDFHPDNIVTLDDINKIPFLQKKDLANNKSALSAMSKNYFTSEKTTGGSTGQVVTLQKNSDALARERAATWRAYDWAGIGIGDRQARFWGTPLHKSQRTKYRVVDFIANRLRFSAFEVNEEKLEEYYQRICKFKPAYLYGYASFIQVFAEYVAKNNYDLPANLKCVITTSEVLTRKAREIIENAFNVKVFNEYGCGEVGSVAHECEYDQMHVMEDNLILEIESEDDSSESGEIVVTDLFNYSTPLIRYKLGDYASFGKGLCECGRGLKVIGNIHGRAYDIIYSPEGNSYHPELVMYIFEDIKDRVGGIDQFQVIQEKLDLITVKIVKGENYAQDLERFITTELNNRLSENISIKFEYVEEIKREASGKLRLIKSNVTP